MQGLVPINFVEQIKDPKEVEIHKKAFASLPPVPRKAWVHPVNGESRIAKPKGTARKMRAIYDYDPIKDSPNGPEAAQVSITIYNIKKLYLLFAMIAQYRLTCNKLSLSIYNIF